MIDFRYHLVSLVSVFLALAVGVVLGAGPLRGQIADSLNSSVDQLRAEKDQLRAEKNIAEAGVKNRDTFTSELIPVVVGKRLPGRSVVLVTVPGSDDAAVEPLTQALEVAGAEVTGQVDLEPAWVAPEKAADRREFAQTWANVLTTPSSTQPSPSATHTPGLAAEPAPSNEAVTDPDAVLAALLARALVTLNALEVGRASPVGGQVLDAFAKKGFVSVHGDLTQRAGQVVVLGPGVQQDSAAAADPKPSPSADLAPTWSGLALALDRASNGAVVLGPASAATTDGVLAAIRADSTLSRRVSTVDTGGTPMGDLTAVLALQEQRNGGAGSYGFGQGATAPMPASLTASVPQSTP